jgi:hypothetical protein
MHGPSSKRLAGGCKGERILSDRPRSLAPGVPAGRFDATPPEVQSPAEGLTLQSRSVAVPETVLRLRPSTARYRSRNMRTCVPLWLISFRMLVMIW